MAERLDSALVRDVMTPSVFTCDAAASAGEVAALLLERGIQRAVITEQGRAVGLVSARDLLRAVVDYERALARA
ncbi:MAG: CBS domain-containing protein [Planctomycetota bacterium]|nr:MAG: CBS domain-containing protein [Planctomycetota bacterium]